LLTDSDGKVAARYETDAFGAPLTPLPTLANPFIFAGREYDPALRLYFNRARWYDPGLGRFVSPDPLAGTARQPASFNRYVYAWNAPTRYTDPLGLYGFYNQNEDVHRVRPDPNYRMDYSRWNISKEVGDRLAGEVAKRLAADPNYVASEGQTNNVLDGHADAISGQPYGYNNGVPPSASDPQTLADAHYIVERTMAVTGTTDGPAGSRGWVESVRANLQQPQQPPGYWSQNPNYNGPGPPEYNEPSPPELNWGDAVLDWGDPYGRRGQLPRQQPPVRQGDPNGPPVVANNTAGPNNGPQPGARQGDPNAPPAEANPTIGPNHANQPAARAGDPNAPPAEANPTVGGNNPPPGAGQQSPTPPTNLNPQVPKAFGTAVVAGANAANAFVACVNEGKSATECAVLTGVSAAAIPPDLGTLRANTAAAGAVAGEVVFFTCMAGGGSPLQCLGQAVQAGATGALCTMIGSTNPVLGAVCGAVIAAGIEGGRAILAQLEASDALANQLSQAESNFANTRAFARRIAALEGQVKGFESEVGPARDACQALNRLDAQAQHIGVASACNATPVNGQGAVLDLEAQAHQAAALARQLVTKLEADRANLMQAITAFSYAYPDTPMLRALVDGWRNRLQATTCSLDDIAKALAAIDQAAAQVVKVNQSGGACPTAPTTTDTCSIYSLNLGGPAIWVGTESDRLQSQASSYDGGSTSSTDPPAVIGRLGTYPNCGAATAAWCQMSKAVPTGYWPGLGAFKRIGGTRYWLGNAPDCSSAPQPIMSSAKLAMMPAPATPLPPPPTLAAYPQPAQPLAPSPTPSAPAPHPAAPQQVIIKDWWPLPPQTKSAPTTPHAGAANSQSPPPSSGPAKASVSGESYGSCVVVGGQTTCTTQTCVTRDGQTSCVESKCTTTNPAGCSPTAVNAAGAAATPASPPAPTPKVAALQCIRPCPRRRSRRCVKRWPPRQLGRPIKPCPLHRCNPRRRPRKLRPLLPSLLRRRRITRHPISAPRERLWHQVRRRW
jgi:RHS repeat-associated protein